MTLQVAEIVGCAVEVDERQRQSEGGLVYVWSQGFPQCHLPFFAMGTEKPITMFRTQRCFGFGGRANTDVQVDGRGPFIWPV